MTNDVTNAATLRQRAFRRRRAAKLARMEAALNRIVDMLKNNDKLLAVKLREIAEEGLDDG